MADELMSRFADLAKDRPNDILVRKSARLLKTAHGVRDQLSPTHRALIGKTVALVVDVSDAAALGGDDAAQHSWLSDVYDGFVDKASAMVRDGYSAAEEAEATAGQKMLDLANWLDDAQNAVKNRADEASLKVANALDEAYETVLDSTANVAQRAGDATARALLKPALVVGTVLAGYYYVSKRRIRRGGRR